MKSLNSNPFASPAVPVVVPANPRHTTNGVHHNAPIATSSDKKVKSAENYGQVQVTGLPIFHVLAGVLEKEEHDDHPADKRGKQVQGNVKTLSHRLPTTQRRQSKKDEKKAVSAAAVHMGKGDDEEEEFLHRAASNTLEILRTQGWLSFRSLLSTKYQDPLERYALLHGIMTEVAKDDSAPVSVRHTLKVMKSELLLKHGEALRNGLAGRDAMQSALDLMSANTGIAPASIHELRNLYGAKGNGKSDAPLTAYTLAKVLQNKFGAEYFSGALADLRQKMAIDLMPDINRSRQRLQPPYLWLTLSDAAAFNSVQSSFGIACDLRRDLTEKALVMPKASHATIAVALLGIAESGGKGKGSILVNQIVDTRNLDSLQQAAVSRTIGGAVRKLPLTMWPADKLPQRAELIAELDEMVIVGHKDIQTWQKRAEDKEQQWLAQLAEKKAEMNDQQSNARILGTAAPAA
ncbi:hypothetical protein ACFQUU_27390 [Herbaspirillum sp. GCM10030257]|uniref:hypothetical protein n=1 Tax=Herbaspirillum sp. GCM10030257 TaxID=3273393 RepID=UPI0036084F4F